MARLIVGKLCDIWGPRITYTWLLLLGSLPVMGIALTHSFATFLLCRILIGGIGAAFVVTQFHTSLMFAPNCVGTANATAAGWGNLGGGVTQLVMPLLMGGLISVIGVSESIGWRLSMVFAGLLCAAAGLAYFFTTQDTPQGNFRQLHADGEKSQKPTTVGTFREACRDYRVWMLFVLYGACFGIELTIDNLGTLYFLDYFDYFKHMESSQALKLAGLITATFGSMNLFARALGGWVGDLCGNRWGSPAREVVVPVLFGEGIGLMMFSQAMSLSIAIPFMIALRRL